VNRVKLICSILTGRAELLDMFRDALIAEYGSVDMESDLLAFDYTDYYEEEMGPDLSRKLYSFERLIDAATIADIKLRTIQIEREMTEAHGIGVGRVVNYDPGYVDKPKMVLATTKDRAHRVYLRDGISAEVSLQFIKGCFEPMPMTYPDYASQEYRNFFVRVREKLCSQ
jgi:hypothetical protein